MTISAEIGKAEQSFNDDDWKKSSGCFSDKIRFQREKKNGFKT